MGATTFCTKAFGKTIGEAFEMAVERAQYHHGKAGYTGTIAEKNGYKKIPDSEHKNKEKREYAFDLIDDQDERIESKWGPAGAIDLSGTQAAKRYRESKGLEGKHGSVWLFFGWASC
jgi:hypothetical protein